jgi:formate-dependent nitrite reductase membrane component NrfD
MARPLRWLIRIAGFLLVLVSLYPYWEALRALDRREYVAAALAALIGWLVTQAGVEFLRPESAE